MIRIEDAKKYALTVFKTCKEIVAVNLIWHGFSALHCIGGYAIEATFVDGTIGRLVARRNSFPLPLFVNYNPGDCNINKNDLWMHVVEDYLWRKDSKNSYSLNSYSLREIGFLKLLGDTFEFVDVPCNLASRDLDELRIELDLMCLGE